MRRKSSCSRVSDPFGDDLQSQTVRHVDDRDGDRRVVRVGRDVADEADIDLEGVDLKALQVGEVGVTRSEIVDGDREFPNPSVAKGAVSLLHHVP